MFELNERIFFFVPFAIESHIRRIYTEKKKIFN